MAPHTGPDDGSEIELGRLATTSSLGQPSQYAIEIQVTLTPDPAATASGSGDQSREAPPAYTEYPDADPATTLQHSSNATEGLSATSDTATPTALLPLTPPAEADVTRPPQAYMAGGYGEAQDSADDAQTQVEPWTEGQEPSAVEAQVPCLHAASRSQCRLCISSAAVGLGGLFVTVIAAQIKCKEPTETGLCVLKAPSGDS